MTIRTARRGAYAGQSFWACDRFPKCWGKRGIAGEGGQPLATVADAAPESEVALRSADRPVRSDSVAGGSAQARFEREQERTRRRMRMAWPALASIAVLVMAIVFFAVLPVGGVPIASTSAVLIGAGFALALERLPLEGRAWRRGAQGERTTASHLRDLDSAGFVILHDRRMPGSRANIDSVAIGPSGVWIIETKRLSGRVEILSERLWVNDQPRDKLVEQVYRQAVEVQIALGGASVQVPPVRPVLCIHHAKLPREKDVRGVTVVNGRQVAGTLRTAAHVLDAEAVQSIAREADRVLRPMRRE